MTEAQMLAAARGDTPSELLLRGGRVINVFTGEIEDVPVAIAGGRIVGLGEAYEADEIVDLRGAYLVPGLIDAHVHIESALVTPPEFARSVVTRGTTTVISDPHEIANVHGLEGIRFMLDASEALPLTVFVMASSCVPATHMSTSGARLGAAELLEVAGHPRVLGLAEVMNFPGVIHGDDDVLRKIQAFAGRPVDGHAPGLRGSALNAYVLGGPGSDHECTTPEEAAEKLSRGLFLFIREATNARNLDALLPALTPGNQHRVALCTDDRQPPDLLDEGGIDAMVRRVIRYGIAPVDAIRMATVNPAGYFGLHDRGAVAPGRVADLVAVEDLESFAIRHVWAGGRRMVDDGRAVDWQAPKAPPPPAPSMRVELAWDAFHVPAQDGPARVIEVIPDQIVTGFRTLEPSKVRGRVVTDPDRDVLKIAVVERHTGSGRVGLGLVHGMGLRHGALAGTVAHDHHNIIAVGVDDASLRTAVNAVADAGGGLAVADGDRLLSLLALDVGGLMSSEPIHDVRRGLDEVVAAARGLGSTLHDPFMAMSFLGLEVIPTLKITDRGLVDVDAFETVPLWV